MTREARQLENAMRLATALELNSPDLNTLSRLLNYNKEQLKQDIQDLWKVVVAANQIYDHTHREDFKIR